MDDAKLLHDEQTVQRLDQSWNEVYVKNDRSAFQQILADDFCGTMPDGRTISKADMMMPTPAGTRVTFSAYAIHLYTPTAIVRGRVLIEHPDRVVDQHFVRVYSKRTNGWQAVAVYVFRVG